MSGKRASWIGLLAIVACAFALTLVSEVASYGGLDLTGSWEAALAHFLRHSWQAGKDYVFTYGPLGYFGTVLFEPALFWHKYAWELVISASLAALLLRVFLRLDPLSRWVFSFVVLTFNFHLADVRLATLILLAVLYLCERPRLGPWTVGCWVLVAAACLVKFTLLLFAVGLAAVLVGSLLWRGHWRLAAAHLGWWLSCLAGWWLALGQSLANVPAYLRGSWELSRAYAVAMALPDAQARQVILAACLLTGVVGCLALVDRRAPGGWAVPLAIVWFLGFQWKLGFSRPDGHEAAFFASAVLAPFFLFTAARPMGAAAVRAAVGLAFVTIALSELPFCTVRDRRPHYDLLDGAGFAQRESARLASRYEQACDQLAYVLRPGAQKAARQRRRTSLLKRPEGLSHIQERVGDESVDCLSFGQGWLLGQGLNWRPRPVFQSYLTYTPWLLRANAEFYRSDRAPRYVAFLTEAIDGRQQTVEDGAALCVILNRYMPILRERRRGLGILLLERSDRLIPEQIGRIELTRTIRLGERLSLPPAVDTLRTLSVRFRPTAWGWLRTLLYQAPTVWLHVATTPGRPLPERFRLLPSTDGAEFLIDPYVFMPEDLLAAYGCTPAAHPLEVSFSAGGDGYRDEVEVVLRSYGLCPRVLAGDCPPPKP